MNRLLLPLILLGLFKLSISEEYAGLILSNVDTLGKYPWWGFDFVTQNSCSLGIYHPGSEPGDNCFSHLHFTHINGISPYYSLTAPNQGYGIKQGKINFDSIITAPPDSIFEKYPWNRVDSLPPDSLAQYIGNVYVIKTGEDPRWGNTMYAKIKILDFSIRDIENHEIDMVFLWACNIDGLPDLATSNLDTLTLDYTVDTINGSAVSSPDIAGKSMVKPVNSIQGFKTVSVNGMVTIPSGMAARNGVLMLFDPKGRVLGQVRNEDISKSRNIRITGGYCGIVVVVR
jgi:hypothetical protein